MYSHCSEGNWYAVLRQLQSTSSVFTVSRDRLRRLMVDGNDVSFPDVIHSFRLDMQLRTCLSCQALPAKLSYTFTCSGWTNPLATSTQLSRPS
ncbi:hypothetical protein OUZ56_016502 [Daphnia magna]|uniref:Uncharacterized protein n=1 Tax=Daphnia magna TaxID=35525 RepID=A0ABR0AQR0_9CRUS|nr:hypothetical protein OUZ56_016502 [Daphnia magna]